MSTTGLLNSRTKKQKQLSSISVLILMLIATNDNESWFYALTATLGRLDPFKETRNIAHTSIWVFILQLTTEWIVWKQDQDLITTGKNESNSFFVI